MKIKVNYWDTTYHWMRIWSHVIIGLVILCFRFPFIEQPEKNRIIQNWSIHLLSILGIQLVLKNADTLPNTPFLLASNHISWVDIHAINAFRPIRFVAKSEVEGWPIFGWMAKQLGTIFIKRSNSRHGKHIANEVAKALKTESVCIFPEGTSTAGESVLPFKPNLFEAAVISHSPVYSLAISYTSLETGERSDIPVFVGDMGLLESMSRILSHRNLAVELTFIFPSGASSEVSRDRKWLALYSQEAILDYLKGHPVPM